MPLSGMASRHRAAEQLGEAEPAAAPKAQRALAARTPENESTMALAAGQLGSGAFVGLKLQVSPSSKPLERLLS